MEETYLSEDVRKEAITGVAKTFLSLIPVAGPFLVEGFFEVPNRLAQKRRDEHIDLILKHLTQVQESLIDIDYLKSEDFSDLFQYVAKKVMMRKAKERAAFFARLSTANVLTTRPSTLPDLQFQFIDILAGLNDDEMHLLAALYKHPSPSGSSVSGISKPFGLDKTEFQLCFDSLLSKGLVYDASLKGLPVNTVVGHNPSPRERIDISPLGKKLIRFIHEVDTIVERAISS